tara:strand:- start:117238 stop:117552 length:315 start_codon:yes stop_codon:yes gene_type:complete
LPDYPGELYESQSGKDSTEVIHVAIKLHDELTLIYREIEAAAEVDSVREIFATLAILEHNEKMRMVRNALKFQDIITAEVRWSASAYGMCIDCKAPVPCTGLVV